MASSHCQCGTPHACTCFSQTPHRANVYYAPYGSPTPQNAWNNQYYQQMQLRPLRRLQLSMPRRVDEGDPSAFEVGPSTAAAAAAAAASDPAFHPSIPNVNLGSLLDKSGPSTTLVSDVWFFSAAPTTPLEPIEMSERRPSKQEFSHLACRFCTGEKWTVWRNGEGQTGNIRHHLRTEHYKLWSDLVVLKKLKGWESVGISAKTAAGEREEFSLPGFHERLVKWIAVDDQSVDVVDCPELRTYCSSSAGIHLEEDNIPHRTKMSQSITTRFRVEYEKMIHEIQNSLGRISFTHDVWTETPADTLVLKTQLVAFRRLEGSQTGENMGKVFVQVLKELKCLHKIRIELRALGIPFDVVGNRIRCFPHVVNIAVKTGLRELADLPAYGPDVDLDLNGSLVTACRACGQRREAFEKVIEEGNASGGWGDPVELLRVVRLLKDVETRPAYYSRDLSAEKTPTLSIVLPMYEKLIVIPSTFLNPTIKLEWIHENWSGEDFTAAKKAIRGAMLEYRKESRCQKSAKDRIPPSTRWHIKSKTTRNSGHDFWRSLESDFLAGSLSLALTSRLSTKRVEALLNDSLAPGSWACCQPQGIEFWVEARSILAATSLTRFSAFIFAPYFKLPTILLWGFKLNSFFIRARVKVLTTSLLGFKVEGFNYLSLRIVKLKLKLNLPWAERGNHAESPMFKSTYLHPTRARLTLLTSMDAWKACPKGNRPEPAIDARNEPQAPTVFGYQITDDSRLRSTSAPIPQGTSAKFSSKFSSAAFKYLAFISSHSDIDQPHQRRFDSMILFGNIKYPGRTDLPHEYILDHDAACGRCKGIALELDWGRAPFNPFTRIPIAKHLQPFEANSAVQVYVRAG
ncbi:hypothetical protein C8F04DRAFT_1190538 [Mycena alexandri]|uniref:Uncharacterized protein n=1 Tax=Mycena alexandri TaxID=1745969 RepID=A0AAD6SJ75_9AGAR|nr:hypothetical protein C8F04DRAFT_1190538 [Mycena alexandri]